MNKLLSLSLLAAPACVFGLGAHDPSVACLNNGLCATTTVTTPSSNDNSNDLSYEHNYFIGLEEGTNILNLASDKVAHHDIGVQTYVVRTVTDDTCKMGMKTVVKEFDNTVKTQRVDCNSCTWCSATSYEYDCSNLSHTFAGGNTVVGEVANTCTNVRDPVFFPFDVVVNLAPPAPAADDKETTTETEDDASSTSEKTIVVESNNNEDSSSTRLWSSTTTSFVTLATSFVALFSMMVV